MSRTFKIVAAVLAVLVIIGVVVGVSVYFSLTVGSVDNDGYYLFCYFTGNDPEDEAVHFALSSDGYNFTPLNNNNAIIKQTLGTLSMRDPYIFRANDKYYIIATDMKSELGWNSNYSMVMWESDDMITWTNERIINLREYDGFEDACRVWAPEVIYDESVNKYMIYWSNCLSSDWSTYILYGYLNDDFTAIEDINTLYKPSSGKDAIDADIIEKDGTYYLYYKDEYEKTICYVYSNNLTGPYNEVEKPSVSTTNANVEGNCIYKLVGTDTYIMIMDKYSKGKYYMQATTDMVNFKAVRSSAYSMKFNPRHGSILTLTKGEYNALLNASW